jgi:hypothetical protein
MKPQGPRNLPASVAARLRDRSRRTGDDYQLLLGAYFCERFLYRLSQSAVRDRFVLKGAMLLRLWADRPYRATRDLDFLRRGVAALDSIRADLETICGANVTPDGVAFDARSIRLEAIRREDEYAGTRARMFATCGSIRMTLQVDLGVGDAAWPPPESRLYPGLLDLPTAPVLAYVPESVVAEKLEAMVVLGQRNSRIKDFFDIQHLAVLRGFEGSVLAESVRRTFARRGTPVPEEEPMGLTTSYWEDPARVIQIRAFARRSGIEVNADIASRILPPLRAFLLPILQEIRRGTHELGEWPPGGPWRLRSRS